MIVHAGLFTKMRKHKVESIGKDVLSAVAKWMYLNHYNPLFDAYRNNVWREVPYGSGFALVCNVVFEHTETVGGSDLYELELELVHRKGGDLRVRGVWRSLWHNRKEDIPSTASGDDVTDISEVILATFKQLTGITETENLPQFERVLGFLNDDKLQPYLPYTLLDKLKSIFASTTIPSDERVKEFLDTHLIRLEYIPGDAIYDVGEHLFDRNQITKETVKQLRAEFLAMVKIARQVNSYPEGRLINDTMREWGKNVDTYIKLFIEELNNVRFSSKFADDAHRIEDSVFEYYSILLNRAAFNLHLVRPSIGYPDEYRSEEQLLYVYRRDLKKWARGVMKDAREAWKALNEFVEWSEDSVEIRPSIPKTEQAEIEGMNITVFGYDSSDDNADKMELMKAGIRKYRERAAVVLPLLLEKQLPLKLNFVLALDTGGRYKRDHIEIWPHTSLGETPEGIAHVLAHEMGHHLYRTVLTSEQREQWSSAVRGDIGDLDLREVLKKMEDVELRSTFIKQNPVMGKQLESLVERPAYRGVDLWGATEIQTYLEGGGDPIVRVDLHPISAYAGKNYEEAFCEAVGLMVGYGTRKVPQEARWWLNELLQGKIHVASVDERLGAVVIPSDERVKEFLDAGKLSTYVPSVPSVDRTLRNQFNEFDKDLKRLTKAFRDVNNEEDATLVHNAFRTYVDNLKTWTRDHFYSGFNPGDDWMEKTLSEKVHDFDMGVLSYEILPTSWNYQTDKHEFSLSQLKRNRKSTIQKYQRKFREFREYVQEAIASQERAVEYGEVYTPEQRSPFPPEERFEIEGSKVVVFNKRRQEYINNYGTDPIKSYLKAVTKGIRTVRSSGFDRSLRDATFFIDFLKHNQVAGRYFPEVSSDYASGSFGQSGEESGIGHTDVVALYPLSNAETVVHELGHRFYFKELTAGERAAWDTIITERNYPIAEEDVTAFVDKYKPANKYRDELRKLIQDQETDPETIAKYLYLSKHSPSFTFDTAEIIQFHIEHNVGELVDAESISDYGATNPMEAFAEAFRLYILDGPRAVGPWTRWFFERITQMARTASVEDTLPSEDRVKHFLDTHLIRLEYIPEDTAYYTADKLDVDKLEKLFSNATRNLRAAAQLAVTLHNEPSTPNGPTALWDAADKFEGEIDDMIDWAYEYAPNLAPDAEKLSYSDDMQSITSLALTSEDEINSTINSVMDALQTFKKQADDAIAYFEVDKYSGRAALATITSSIEGLLDEYMSLGGPIFENAHLRSRIDDCSTAERQLILAEVDKYHKFRASAGGYGNKMLALLKYVAPLPTEGILTDEADTLKDALMALNGALIGIDTSLTAFYLRFGLVQAVSDVEKKKRVEAVQQAIPPVENAFDAFMQTFGDYPLTEQITIDGTLPVSVHNYERTSYDSDLLDTGIRNIKGATDKIKRAGFGQALKDLRATISFSQGRASATYNRDSSPTTSVINLHPAGLTNEYVFIHEVGHRYYYRELTEGQRATWVADFKQRNVTVTEKAVQTFLDTYVGPWVAGYFGEDKSTIAERMQKTIGERESDPKTRIVFVNLMNRLLDNVERKSVPGVAAPVGYNDAEWVLKHLINEEITVKVEPESSMFVTNYGETNPSEYFAESFMEYVDKGPRALKPPVRAFFENIVVGRRRQASVETELPSNERVKHFLDTHLIRLEYIPEDAIPTSDGKHSIMATFDRWEAAFESFIKTYEDFSTEATIENTKAFHELQQQYTKLTNSFKFIPSAVVPRETEERAALEGMSHLSSALFPSEYGELYYEHNLPYNPSIPDKRKAVTRLRKAIRKARSALDGYVETQFGTYPTTENYSVGGTQVQLSNRGRAQAVQEFVISAIRSSLAAIRSRLDAYIHLPSSASTDDVASFDALHTELRTLSSQLRRGTKIAGDAIHELAIDIGVTISKLFEPDAITSTKVRRLKGANHVFDVIDTFQSAILHNPIYMEGADADKLLVQKKLDAVREGVNAVRRAGFGRALRDIKFDVRFAPSTEKTWNDSTVGGTYFTNQDVVTLYEASPYVITHEIGHRFYYVMLENNARSTWEEAFKQQRFTITAEDIQTFQDKYLDDFMAGKFGVTPRSKKGLVRIQKTESDFETRAKFDELMRSLQENINIKPKPGIADLKTKEDAEWWLSTQKTKIVDKGTNYKEFISDYSKLNASEAFAEAFRIYTTMGPRALGPWTRAFFERIVHAAKTASVTKTYTIPTVQQVKDFLNGNFSDFLPAKASLDQLPEYTYAPNSVNAKPGEFVRVPSLGIKLWTELVDSDEAFAPNIASYKVVDGWLVYKGRHGEEGIVVGTEDELKKWVRDVADLVKIAPVAGEETPWDASYGGEDNVNAALAAIDMATKAFGIDKMKTDVVVIPNMEPQGRGGSDHTLLINVHKGGTIDYLNGKVKVPYSQHVAIHEVAHSGFSARRELADAVMSVLNARRERGEDSLTIYAAMTDAFEETMEAAAFYLLAPDKMRELVPSVYDATKAWVENSELQPGEAITGAFTPDDRPKKCMNKGCKNPAIIGILWADGRATASFCKPCFQKFRKETKHSEIVRQWKIKTASADVTAALSKRIVSGVWYYGVVKDKSAGKGFPKGAQVVFRINQPSLDTHAPVYDVLLADGDNVRRKTRLSKYQFDAWIDKHSPMEPKQYFEVPSRLQRTYNDAATR